MGTFQPILSELIKTGVVINHYPQFNYFEILDNNGIVLIKLYTQKSSQKLAMQYNLSVNQLIRNRYYKFETKLKIIMEKLTKKQVITLCKKVISRIQSAKKLGLYAFLDTYIKTEIQEMFPKLERWEIEITDYIPEFTLQNAKIMCNAEESEIDNSIWWEGSKSNFDYDNRIKFMEFIIECQKNK